MPFAADLAGGHPGRPVAADRGARDGFAVERVGRVDAGEAGERLDHAQPLGLDDVGQQGTEAGMHARAAKREILAGWRRLGRRERVPFGGAQVAGRDARACFQLLAVRLDRQHHLIDVPAAQHVQLRHEFQHEPPATSRLVASLSVAQLRATSIRSSSAPDGGMASTDKVVANHWLDAPTISSRACSPQPFGLEHR